MAELSLEQAQRIIAAFRRRMSAAGSDATAVAVIDEFGDLLIMDRRELVTRTTPFARLGESVPAHIVALASHFGEPIHLGSAMFKEFLGGILIRGADGHVLGALGLSGDMAGPETANAALAIEEAGLIADLGVSVH